MRSIVMAMHMYRNFGGIAIYSIDVAAEEKKLYDPGCSS